MLRALRKGAHTVSGRLRAQGVRTTALWAYARGIPYITGVPLLAYSRVTPSLYVGPQHRENGKRALLQAGITHTVNMRSEFDDAAHGLALDATPTRESYCHLPTPDDHAPSPAHLSAGVAFIDGAIEDGGKVYIHCSAGVGRAPTMAAAYLISRGHSLEDALALIRTARPFIRLTPTQMTALAQFESGVSSPTCGSANPPRTA